MNETDAVHGHLHRYGSILSTRVNHIYNALEELQRTRIASTSISPMWSCPRFHLTQNQQVTESEIRTHGI